MRTAGGDGCDRGTDGVALRSARLAHAHWFFGNLYEEIVRMPDRLADDREAGRREGLLTGGSPVHYYLPAAPLLLASTGAAVAGRWHRSEARRALLAGAVCSAAGVVMTGYLIPTVNHRLLVGPKLPEQERQQLVKRWHRINRARLMLAAGASVAFRLAAR